MPNEQEQVKQFANEIARVLNEYRSNDVLSTATRRHQRSLIELLSGLDDTMKGVASKRDLERFDDLVTTADLSHRLMMEMKEDDEDFQEELLRVGNSLKKSDSFTGQVLERLSLSMPDLRDAVSGLLKDETKDDIRSVSMDWTIGPIGKAIYDAIDSANLKDRLQRIRDWNTERRERNSHSRLIDGSVPIQGQAHDGMTSVPREGTYILDGGERVLSSSQNEDLVSFMNRNIQDDYEIPQPIGIRADEPVPVFMVDYKPGFFHELMEDNYSNALHDRNIRQTQHKETMGRFTRLYEVITRSAMNLIHRNWMSFQIHFRRFMRHPIWNTLIFAIGGISKAISVPLKAIFSPVTKWIQDTYGFLFGRKRQSDTDRIVGASNEIRDVLRGRDIGSDRGWVQKTLSGLFSTELTGRRRGMTGIEIAQEVEDRLARGESKDSLGETRKETRELLKTHKKFSEFITKRSGISSAAGEQPTIIPAAMTQKSQFTRADTSSNVIPMFGAAGMSRSQQQKMRFGERRQDPSMGIISEIGEDLRLLVAVNEEHLDETSKMRKSGRGGFMGALSGSILGRPLLWLGGILGTFLFTPLRSILTTGFKSVGKGIGGTISRYVIRPLSRVMPDALKNFGRTVGRYGNRFGATIARLFPSIGRSLITSIATNGPRLFSAAGLRILGAVGAAFSVGDLIGKYIVNPLINALDSAFDLGIGDTIGKMVHKTIVLLEKIPFVKKLTGGHATELEESMKRQREQETEYRVQSDKAVSESSGRTIGQFIGDTFFKAVSQVEKIPLVNDMTGGSLTRYNEERLLTNEFTSIYRSSPPTVPAVQESMNVIADAEIARVYDSGIDLPTINRPEISINATNDSAYSADMLEELRLSNQLMRQQIAEERRKANMPQQAPIINDNRNRDLVSGM